RRPPLQKREGKDLRPLPPQRPPDGHPDRGAGGADRDLCLFGGQPDQLFRPVLIRAAPAATSKCRRALRPAQRPGARPAAFGVAQKRHAPGGTHFCLLRRTEISSPWLSCASPVFAARHGGRLRKPERCASRAFAASSTGRAWRGCPLGTKLSAEPCTRRKAARTLSALNFPVCVPSIRTCRLDGTF